MRQIYEETAKELAEAATLLTEAGLVRGWSGSLSARCPQSNGYSVVIKRSGGSVADPAAYCHVASDGKHPEPTDARPSLVTRVHCAIYRSCPDVHAVITCRGLYADAVAAVMGEMPLSLEIFWALKTSPIILDANALCSETYDKYVDRMAVEVSKSLAKPKKGATVVCIPFYGMWVTGSSVAETVKRALALEDMAKSAYLRISLAKTIGMENPEFPPWFGKMLQELVRPPSNEEIAKKPASFKAKEQRKNQ